MTALYILAMVPAALVLIGVFAAMFADDLEEWLFITLFVIADLAAMAAFAWGLSGLIA